MTLKKYIWFYAIAVIVVVLGTFYLLPEYSIFGFIIIGLGVLEFASEAYQKLFDEKLDGARLLQAGNMPVAIVLAARYIAYAIVIAAALFAVPKAIGQELPPHVAVARGYIGTIEQRGNRGAEIDKWNHEAHVAMGSPYCAAFVAHCLNAAHAKSPAYRGAYARNYITRESKSLPLKSNVTGDLKGWLVVFKRKAGGHLAIIQQGSAGQSIVKTIEANTTREGYAGSQYDGGGVFERLRNLRALASPYNMFRATHITPVRYL